MKIKNIFLILFFVIAISCASATTITVDLNSSEGNNSFSSVQDAINYSQDNNFIVIHNGSYYENLVVDKPLKIKSASGNPDDVVIISSSVSHLPVIHVKSSNVEIAGLTVTGKEEKTISGIFLDNVDNCHIINSKITNTTDGILADHSSKNSIQNNVLVSNTFHAISFINSNDNDFEENSIYNNERGVYLNNSDGNVVINNEVYNNLHYGIALLESDNNYITNNGLLLNQFGLTLTSSHQNTIISNSASNNKQHGFFLFQATSNHIKDNTLVENNDSGVCIFVFSTNNTITENNISENVNGISITASDNYIVNNTFISNDNYGIFHLSTSHENTIKGNTFQDNPSENKKIEFWKQVLLFILILLGVSVAAFVFKISWLKKVLLGLTILIIVSVILLLIWYFPFESDLPGNNVYIEDLQLNAVPINETHSRVTVSMNLNYQNKDSFEHTNNTGSMVDNLPVFVQIKTSTPADGSYSDEDTRLAHEEEVVLEYLDSNPYEYTLDLKSGKTYMILVEVQMFEELPYPHPYYGESKWEFLGGLREELDLRENIH